MSSCHLCGAEALALFFLDRGCIAYPQLRRQWLCYHHCLRSRPLGGMVLLCDLSLDQALVSGKVSGCWQVPETE